MKWTLYGKMLAAAFVIAGGGILVSVIWKSAPAAILVTALASLAGIYIAERQEKLKAKIK